MDSATMIEEPECTEDDIRYLPAFRFWYIMGAGKPSPLEAANTPASMANSFEKYVQYVKLVMAEQRATSQAMDAMQNKMSSV